MNIADLLLLLLLGLGFLVGFFRGLIRAVLAIAAWAISFLLGAYIRNPIGDWLARSADFNSFYANMLAFGAVFFLIFGALILLITLSRTPTSLTGHRLFDDIFGGLFGIVTVVLVVAAVIVIFNTYYKVENPPASVDLGGLAEIHRALVGSNGVGGSSIAMAISNTVVHWIAFVLGPLLPVELVQVM
jgi:uncharacterized membrane protein required for colicin V production